MSSSPQLCLETLKYWRDEFMMRPSVCEVIDRASKMISNGCEDHYGVFIDCVRRLRDIVGESSLHNALNKPRDELKKNMKLFICGTPHRAVCVDRLCSKRECVVFREVNLHMEQASLRIPCAVVSCSICRLTRELDKFWKKRALLYARYGIGEKGLLDFITHVRGCRIGTCNHSYAFYSCAKTRHYFSHERQCFDLDCSCSLMEPCLRLVDKPDDEDVFINATPVEQMFDIVYQSGIDEEQMRLESIMLKPEAWSGEERCPKRKNVGISPEIQYVWSIGVSGSID